MLLKRSDPYIFLDTCYFSLDKFGLSFLLLVLIFMNYLRHTKENVYYVFIRFD